MPKTRKTSWPPEADNDLRKILEDEKFDPKDESVIRVTKRPKLTLVCYGCHAELEFELSDLTHMTAGGSYCEDGRLAAGLVCPDCSTQTEYDHAPYALVNKLYLENKRK